MRAVFESVDAVVLATPEFGGGAAGAAKNALDWMVGSGSLYERACGVVSAGTTGGANSIEQIARTLAWQGAFVVETLGIATPRASRNEDGQFVDEKSLIAFDAVGEAILGIHGLSNELMRARASEKLCSLGISPENRSGR
jgi:NAD(P)H-dependent FMN reductase